MPPSADESDEALHLRVRRGEVAAFDALFARYERRLFAFILGQIGNRADAEELFHDAFLATLKERDARFHREGAFRTWLFRVARNLASNRARGGRRGARALASIAAEEPVVEASIDAALEARTLAHAMEEAVARLPAPMADLFHLRTSGLSYEEMANVLEVPLGTLKSRMHQLIARLREELRPWTAR